MATPRLHILSLSHMKHLLPQTIVRRGFKGHHHPGKGLSGVCSKGTITQAKVRDNSSINNTQ
eukprot:59924-Chlamydomonas_euryale.AAC.1